MIKYLSFKSIKMWSSWENSASSYENTTITVLPFKGIRTGLYQKQIHGSNFTRTQKQINGYNFQGSKSFGITKGEPSSDSSLH